MKFVILVCLLVASVVAEDTNIEKFASSSNAFTADIYQVCQCQIIPIYRKSFQEVLLDTKENILVSPFSVETLLALTQAGAVGKTGAEIRTVLRLPETVEETDSLLRTILPTFHNDKYKIHTANKIYVENKFEIRDQFKSIATDDYEAAFENIEFSDSASAIEEINTWVKEETEGKIQNLMQPGDVDDTTRLVLVNALYFQANFSLPFIITNTKEASFYTSQDKSIKTNLMFKEAELLNYAENDELDAQIVELPFVGTGASLILVVPKQAEGIALLEKQSASIISAPKFAKRFVQVSLPRFKIESTIDFGSLLQKVNK